MTAKLIAYDLNYETKRPDIVGDIKSYGTWARLSESSYVIYTLDTVDKVYDKLSKHIDGNDQLYVISVGKPYSGYGPSDVNDWLQNNMN